MPTTEDLRGRHRAVTGPILTQIPDWPSLTRFLQFKFLWDPYTSSTLDYITKTDFTTSDTPLRAELSYSVWDADQISQRIFTGLLRTGHNILAFINFTESLVVSYRIERK